MIIEIVEPVPTGFGISLTGPQGPAGETGPAGPTGEDGRSVPGFNANVADFISTTPFFIAHRGSGDVYPEHTMASYESAVAAGAKAIEVSVNITADGVLVCHHDLDTTRMTGVSGNIVDKPYAGIRNNIKVDARTFLGPNWELQKLPTLREVFDRFAGRVVMFVEPKNPSTACVNAVIAMINEYGINDSVVWKEYHALNYVKAHAAGLPVWGYLDPADSESTITDVASKSEYLGVNISSSDSVIQSVVSRGKPVICWPLSRRSEVTRVQALGVVGMMCASWKYLSSSSQIYTKDTFAHGVRFPGEHPLDINTAANQPTWNTTDGSRAFPGNAGQSLLLGGLGPITAGTYSISFDARFNTLPSDTNLHIGLAFGKTDDKVYQFNTANATGGYHVVFRANGQMQLYTHTAGVTTGTQLSAVTTNAAVANTWCSFKIDVTPTQITVTRTDASAGGTNTFTVTNNTYRGGYIHLSKHSVTSANTVEFKNVVIS